ncbi:MAG TPA: cache domain-containing protein [Leptolyngbyaceae cyanobacterium]
MHPATIRKILRCQGVDKDSIALVFKAVNLQLELEDYTGARRVLELAGEQGSRGAEETTYSRVNHDWGEEVDVTLFCGRSAEISTLQQWVLNDHCRLVALLGNGGIGKTTLVTKLAEEIQNQFEFLIWRSLRNAPLLGELLDDLLKVLSAQQTIELPNTTALKISRLMEYLRQHRCLLVLDNLETLMQDGSYAGSFQAEYEGYGELLRRVGEVAHQSCLLITSREKPNEIAALAGEILPVRSLQLTGLNTEAQEILTIKGLSVSQQESQQLIDLYSGNPLALKIVATAIKDLFSGDVSAFLATGISSFNSIRALLNQQFERLTQAEKSVMYWLAINREGVLSNYNLYSYKVNGKGQRTQLPEIIKNFDPRSRPFYQTAIKQRQFSFSQIYAPLTEKTLRISASVPIYNSQGKLLGVNTTLSHLSDIGKYLRNLKVGKSGQIFILERSGLLVASSTGEQPFFFKNGSTIRLPATESSNYLTQATSKFLASKFGNLNKIHHLQELKFSVNGQRQFLEIQPFNSETNINWLIAVVIPEGDFMEQINRHTQITIFLCLGAFVLATTLGILTTRWIAQPVLRLSRAAKALAQTAADGSFSNDAESVVIVEGITELEVLGQSFNQMSQELRASFEQLELRVEQRTQELQQEIRERIQNEQQLRQHSQALSELAKHRAISAGDLETAFHIITEKAAQALEVERVSIWLYNSDRSKLQKTN